MLLVARVEHNISGESIITKHQKYYGELSVTMYDKDTFMPYTYWIVTCDDDITRKFTLDYFIEIKINRDKRIDELLA